jgi:multidrug transporter EmrE-like cation transporter
MSYLYLFGTILFESIGVTLLNKSDGFSNWKYLGSGLLFFNAGMIAFAMALKGMDMTIANTTWAGASILIVAIIGYFIFDERYQFMQYLYIGLVLIGLVGLNASGVSK